MRYDDFLNIFKDSTSQYFKIKKEEYLPEGKYPIIDQGQTYIGGYTNDENLISSENLPVIVFGDHTKVFKYVDFPFAIGADGVKVLTLKDELYNAQYYFHFLKGIQLIDAGYSRHFKYLKDKKLPVPKEVPTQLHIANILSKTESLIAQRKDSIRLLDEYLKSVFLEMFGETREILESDDVRTIGEICNYRGGGTPSKSKPEYYIGNIPWVSPKDMKTLYISTSQDKITQQAIDESSTALIPRNSLLMVIRSGILKSKLPLAINSVDVTINQDMKAFNSEIVNTQYLLYFFFAEERNILKKVKGTTADNLNFEDIKNLKIKIPPVELQTKFAQIVEKTEALKAQYQQSLQELGNLYGSLSQKAFKGELRIKDESLLLAADPETKYGEK